MTDFGKEIDSEIDSVNKLIILSLQVFARYIKVAAAGC